MIDLGLEEGPIKKWYERDNQINMLRNLVSEKKHLGYELDPKSGLLFRRPYSDEVIKRLGYLVIDIIFPRPTDFHYHRDVDEAVSVLDGAGNLIMGDLKERIALKAGKNVIIPKNEPHAFVPDHYNFLETLLVCSGILDPNEEICVERFDKLKL